MIKRGDRRERVHGQMLGGRFTPLGVSQLSNLLSHVFTKRKDGGSLCVLPLYCCIVLLELNFIVFLLLFLVTPTSFLEEKSEIQNAKIRSTGRLTRRCLCPLGNLDHWQ